MSECHREPWNVPECPLAFSNFPSTFLFLWQLFRGLGLTKLGSHFLADKTNYLGYLILFYLLVCTCISFTLSWILYFYTRCGKGFSSVTFPLAFLLLLSSCYSHPSLFSDSSSQKYCKFSNRVLVTLTLHKTCGVSS